VSNDVEPDGLQKLQDTMTALQSTDPTDEDQALVRTLENLVRSVSGSVQGSDAGRKALAGNMMGNAMTFGAHQLFLTVNFSDLNDLRCYQEAERLHVVLTIAAKVPDEYGSGNSEGPHPNCVPYRTEASGLWPDAATRINTAIANPAAVATYFHENVKLYLAAFMQFPLSDVRGNKSARTGEGLFGLVESYAGTVETQMRGSLHLHILIWLVSRSVLYALRP
jgi:hypothetical protein